MIPNRYLKDETKVGDFYKVKEFVLAHSYLISNKGANKLIHKTPNLPEDLPVFDVTTVVKVTLKNGDKKEYKKLVKFDLR